MEKKLFELPVRVKGITNGQAQVFNLAIQEFKRIIEETTMIPLRNHEKGLDSILIKYEFNKRVLEAIPNQDGVNQDIIDGLLKEQTIAMDAIKKYEENVELLQGNKKYAETLITDLERMIKEQRFDDHVLYTYDVRIDADLFTKIITLLFQIDIKDEEQV